MYVVRASSDPNTSKPIRLYFHLWSYTKNPLGGYIYNVLDLSKMRTRSEPIWHFVA